ncbi:hypothetical protein BDN67DRAFT_975213 [Paxillus ammoniavirescens]|nr:hypothetical protein BDN67DRAFT_975213 [Paxillus ammoniavirescens]
MSMHRQMYGSVPGHRQSTTVRSEFCNRCPSILRLAYCSLFGICPTIVIGWSGLGKLNSHAVDFPPCFYPVLTIIGTRYGNDSLPLRELGPPFLRTSHGWKPRADCRHSMFPTRAPPRTSVFR